MTSGSGIPRPFSITDAKRSREEEARKREQATSARNTSSTTIGSGGRLDVVGGDLTISDGGNASVKDGGAFRVEGGGSMEITDDGVVKVVGSTVDDLTDAVMVAEAALSTEEIHHTSSGVTTRSPGLFFKTERFSGGKVSSFWGDDVSVISGKRMVDYGPLVEPGVYKSTSAQVNPGSAGLYASAAFGLNPDFTDSRSQCYMEVYPDALVFELRTVALGIVGSINVSMLDPKLRLYGRDGVDVKGPFTVDGAPVGGAVDSVAGKTGAVTLVKADVGLGNVDNTSDAAKPVSTATQAALDGKASTAVATTTAAGLMPSTDKTKLDNATPSPTANRLIYRDTSGRAQISDPAVAADIATKGYVDTVAGSPASALIAPLPMAGYTVSGNFCIKAAPGGVSEIIADIQTVRTGGTLSLSTSWTALGTILPASMLKAGAGLRYFTAFSSAPGSIYMYINFENGACGVKAVSGTISALNTSIFSFSQAVLV